MLKISEEMDISVFLSWVNAALAAGIFLSFIFAGPNGHVNAFTVYLSLAFAVQNHFFLSVAKRNPDPFLLLLVMHALFFYEFRVATLIWDPWSTVLARSTFETAHLSGGLLYVIMANFAIFLGLSARSPDAYSAADNGGVKGGVHMLLPILLFFVGLPTEMGFEAFDGVRGYFGILVNPEMILLLTLIIGILYYGAMTRLQRLSVFLIAFAFVAHRTFIGSRSAVMTLFFFLFCAWFAVRERAVFSKKLYLLAAGAVPLTVMLFVFATVARSGYSSAPISWRYSVPYRAILDRLGYLDMGAEIGANSLRYSGVLNFEHYFKSVVDNALTPGFNVFDTPKAANALSYVYRGIPGVSLKSVHAGYQSDVLTVYGEMRVLFGRLPGLLAMFILAFLFQRLYRVVPGGDPFKRSALRAVILLVFYMYFLNSFGLDWFLVDLVRSVVPFLLLFYLFSRYVRRVTGGGRRDYDDHIRPL